MWQCDDFKAVNGEIQRQQDRREERHDSLDGNLKGQEQGQQTHAHAKSQQFGLEGNAAFAQQRNAELHVQRIICAA